MNQIAVLFRTAPHGVAAGREGLDAVLACSALTDEISVFFIGDGVYQLVAGQQPAAILGRDYTPTFKLFGLYDIEQVYLCDESLSERQLTVDQLLFPAQRLSRAEIRTRLQAHRVRLVF